MRSDVTTGKCYMYMGVGSDDTTNINVSSV
jgi:hypothetical protein